MIFVDFASMKRPEFLKINPNGRKSLSIFVCGTCLTIDLGIPAIVDHDNDSLTLWESGAIMQYLAQRYDKINKISFPIGTKENALVNQWISYQISGQVRFCHVSTFLVSHYCLSLDLGPIFWSSCIFSEVSSRETPHCYRKISQRGLSSSTLYL